MRQATNEATFLKPRDQAVNAALGLHAQRVLHLVERRRDTVTVEVLMNEAEQFVLFSGEHVMRLAGPHNLIANHNI